MALLFEYPYIQDTVFHNTVHSHCDLFTPRRKSFVCLFGYFIYPLREILVLVFHLFLAGNLFWYFIYPLREIFHLSLVLVFHLSLTGNLFWYFIYPLREIRVALPG